MYCPSCGDEVAEDNAYCSRCGESLDGGASVSSGWDTEDVGAGDAGTRVGDSGDTTMGALTHLIALVTWILGPLVVYIVTEDGFVKENSRNALNWQIAFTVYSIISAFLIIIVIGVLFLVVLGILNLVFCVIAAVKASDGETWEYPFTPDLV
jgi:uncharacterized Tic20 family protein